MLLWKAGEHVRGGAPMISIAAWADGLQKDLRYAAHSLASQPGFTAMALLALFVGIALNVGVFTAINAILTRPWAVPEPERVVNAYTFNPKAGVGYAGFSLAAARFLNDNSRTVEGAFATRDRGVRVVAGGVDAATNAAFVTANLFDVLDVRIAPGRGFRAEEDDAAAPAAVAVISHWLWTQRYGADPNVAGQAVTVDGVPFTIIGVADPSFLSLGEDRMDVWLPFSSLQLVTQTTPELFNDPIHCCSEVAARLRPGVSREQATAEWSTLLSEYLRELALDPPQIVLTGTAMLDHPQRRQQAAVPMTVAMIAFAAVLLLACANVTNLLLARAAARQSEVAVRMAIGAGRGRILRQLLTEAALLAVIAVALCLPLTYVLPRAALLLMGQELPTALSLAPNGNVLLYAVGLATFCTIAFGLAPALQATRADLSAAMKGRGAVTARRTRLRSVSLGIQVAVSTALLVAAGLLVRGVDFARDVDFGFRIDGISAVAVTLPPNAHTPEAEVELFETVVARLDSAEPVALSFLMPLGERHEFAGASCTERTFVRTHRVTPAFFDVLRIPVVEGRAMTNADMQRNAVVVNEAFARRCSAGQTLAGQAREIGGSQREIVGVVRDAQLHGTGGVDPIVFEPFTPSPVFRGQAIILLPTPLAERAAGFVRDLDGRATAEVVEMREQVERWLGDSAGLARMVGVVGFLALVLAAVGVYGVFSYYVEQRRREIGVRMALGAQPRQIVRLVVRQNATALAAGLAAGLVVAAAESMVLRSELHGLNPADPYAYLGVLLVMLAVGFFASALPARRATRTDPNTVLHCD